jgi:hypothetical protein
VAATNNPGVNVIKLFTFITDNEDQSARGFALGNNFQSAFEGKARANPIGGPFRYFPLG